MLGWKLFAHSLRMVFSNFNALLQVLAVPVLMQLGALAVLFALGLTSGADRLAPGLILMLPLGIFAWLWVAVNWHRYILLEEHPRGWVQPIHGSHMWAYLLQAILIGMVLLLGFAAPALILSQEAPIIGLTSVLIMIVLLVLAIVFSLRLSVVLPAVATGRKMTFGNALTATKGKMGALLALVLISQGVFLLVGLVNASISAALPMLGPVLEFATTLLIGVINISLLTTLYGHFVERRALG